MAVADSDEDWRLRVQLHEGGEGARAHGIVSRFRGPQVARDAERAIGGEVHLTHDGSTLFAYARDLVALQAARGALLDAIDSEGLSAQITLSHWEQDVGDWAQVEPPPTDAARADHERALRDAHAPTTQTFVVQAGVAVRESLERSMSEWAQTLGLRCELVEHPHLLATQVAFTVSGPAHAVGQFREGLDAEERRTIRSAETISFSL